MLYITQALGTLLTALIALVQLNLMYEFLLYTVLMVAVVILSMVSAMVLCWHSWCVFFTNILGHARLRALIFLYNEAHRHGASG